MTMEEFISETIVSMSVKFNPEQLQYIRNVLQAESAKYSITISGTAVIVSDEVAQKRAKEWLVKLWTDGVSQGTLDNYRRTISTFVTALNKPIDEISANDISLFLFQYKQKRGVSNRTLDGVRTVVCSFCKWLAAEGYLNRDITLNIRPIKYTEKEVQAFTDVEMEIIRRSCDSIWERFLVEFLYSTGCRASEASNALWKDFDAEHQTLYIRVAKNDERRTVYISDMCLHYAKAYRSYLEAIGALNDYILVQQRAPHNQLSREGINVRLKDIEKRCGDQISGSIHAHRFRHTLATHAVNSGTMPIESIQKVLGHASPSTTMIYAKKNTQQVHEEFRKCFC